MRCESCGGSTRVTDTRDEATAREDDYLLRKGQDVYGWWAGDGGYRVRRRVCTTCGDSGATIEVPLSDLDKAFDDLRSRRVELPAGTRQISTTQLVKILDTHSSSEDALSQLLSELLYRRRHT
jgi:hypothetical protein